MSEPTLASWGFVALCELELGLGLSLCANFRPSLLRWVALVLFAAFAGVALQKVAVGASSCACLGEIEIAPSAMVIVDLCILTALWCWRPVARAGFTWLKAGLSVTLLVVAPWPLVAALRPPPYPRLVVAPIIDLGELGPGERRSFAIGVRNPHHAAVDIVAVESTCPCLEAEQVRCRIGPGESGTLHLCLDMAREPAFFGALALEIKGKGEDGAIAFRNEVRVVVRGGNLHGRLSRRDKGSWHLRVSRPNCNESCAAAKQRLELKNPLEEGFQK